MDPLHELREYGQSYWLDNLTRPMIRSGELDRRVREQGLRGVTSNPAIFSQAIAGGDAYDEQIRELVRERRSVQAIYEALTVRDIQEACDVLRPVHEESDGTDGFVSLEVSPYLARNTEATVEEARRLFDAVDRPNVMIKIPGTLEGVPAIERCLVEGINVNVTLLFSVERYRRVAQAYLRALERRLEAGRPVDDVASVASFFLSRIDVLVDRLLGDRMDTGAHGDRIRPQDVTGRVAIANARIAYQRFRGILDGDRWAHLEEHGARPQRLLWASTSTKDPLYSDVRYVESLIGPHTVNTLPDRTVEAFADHGRVQRTVDRDVEEAERVLAALPRVLSAHSALEREIHELADRLEDEGIRKFVEPFDHLMRTLARRRRTFLGEHAVRDHYSRGNEAPDHDGGLDSLDRLRFARRLFDHDPSLWSSDAGEQAAIAERLGWLDAPVRFWDRREELTSFARRVGEEDLDHVVWLGMGGSSLAPEVTQRVFGVGQGYPEFVMLDDTDPDAVRATRERVDLTRTLFVVASKSGTTAETLSFYRYFRRAVEEAGVPEPGDRFVAVTDPATPLAEEASSAGFRRTFENPPDVGGRYSALTFFGLVAMALQGVDIEDLLACASQMRCSCGPLVPASASPGLRLGAFLGLWARNGRDKVTLSTSPTLAPFGRWLEQLLAESTGKEGTGLVPVVDESLAGPGTYGDDRIFVRVRIPSEEDPATTERLGALEEAGHPVVVLEPACDIGLGAEFFRWQVATAAAGAILGVNPFDEPNVAESKENTRELLAARRKEGELPEGEPVARGRHLAAYADPDASWLPGDAADGDPLRVVESLLRTVEAGDYVALLPYLRHTSDRHRRLDALRTLIRDQTRAATTLGHGPRYLHSTGQLHKGGPDRGVYLLVTAGSRADVEIPGEPFGFATLQKAQALGDQRALTDRGRPVVRVHLEGDVPEALGRLVEAVRREKPDRLVS